MTLDPTDPRSVRVASSRGRGMVLGAGGRVGGYEIVELIAVGGMGEVYRAVDPKLASAYAYFLPLDKLQLRPETQLYLGLIHYNDASGDAARLASARRHVHVDGIGTECGMARGDPARLSALLEAHVRAAQIAV